MVAGHHAERGGSYRGEGRRALVVMALVLLGLVLCGVLGARASHSRAAGTPGAHFSPLAGPVVVFYGPNGSSLRLPVGGIVGPHQRGTTPATARAYPVRSGST
jgi:hypothetical protein